VDAQIGVTTGVIVADGQTLAVNVAGAIMPATLPVGYEPAIGDIVNVLKAGDRCFVFAVTGKTLDEYTPPPPGTIESGVDKFLAGFAGTYARRDAQPPGWESHVVTQGDLPTFNSSYRGAWFYGINPTRLKGRTITRCRLWLPGVVYWGRASLTTGRLDIHLLGQVARPGGDASPIQGPIYHTIEKTFQGAWVTLPTQWGQHLADNGGGLGLRGTEPIGLASLTGSSTYKADLTSGQIELAWSRTY